jgi:type I pantothenate kinase
MEVRDGYAPLARLVAARSDAPRSLILGIAGGVAVGKSTAAAAVRELLAPRHVEVVATDGFLLPNAVLQTMGILHRKGFPESYDAPAVEQFLDAMRGGNTDVTVPVYSHVTYDVVAGERLPVAHPDVLILEGVNALQFADRLDIGVYLQAPEGAMEAWYLARFLELCETPPPRSFYEGFADLDVDARRALAGDVWRSVNLANLHECIQPTRRRAQIIVEKRADHSVARTDVIGLVS